MTYVKLAIFDDASSLQGTFALSQCQIFYNLVIENTRLMDFTSIKNIVLTLLFYDLLRP